LNINGDDFYHCRYVDVDFRWSPIRPSTDEIADIRNLSTLKMLILSAKQYVVNGKRLSKDSREI